MRKQFINEISLMRVRKSGRVDADGKALGRGPRCEPVRKDVREGGSRRGSPFPEGSRRQSRKEEREWGPSLERQ